MRIHRVQLDTLTLGEQRLSAQESHHLARVLRVQLGQRIQAFDGRGYEAEGVISAIDSQGVSVTLREAQRSYVEASRKLSLAVGLPKGDRFENIVRMGTELGVARFIPLKTDYGDVPSLKANKLARYQRIAQEAAKQSGRSLVPEVLPMHTLNELMAQAHVGQEADDGLEPPTQIIMADPYVTQSLADIHCDDAVPILCVTGAEGGFSQAEVAYLQQHEVISVHLGRRILKADTAPIALASILLINT